MGGPKLGDVFIVPIDADRAGVGQVVANYEDVGYFFAIFDCVLSLDRAPNQAVEAVTRPVLLLALSLGAKIHAGHWTVVGRGAISPTIPFPAYKEATSNSGNFYVVDYSGRRRRPATPIEAQTLPNRRVVAPVRLERALRASVGLEPWLDAFEDVRVRGGVTSADIFG